MPSDPPAHVFPVRVYFEDTDAGGIVYYANYLKYAERARSEMLRAHGIESTSLMIEDGVALAVRECHVDYLKPARLDDALEVMTRVTEVGGASLRLSQTVSAADGERVAMDIRLACMNQAGRPARLPERLVAVLAGVDG